MTSEPPPSAQFPRGALLGAAGLIGISLLMASVGRLTGVGISHVPEAAPLESRDLRFQDRADGAVTIYEGRSDRLVDVLPPGSNGFIRGVLRGLVRERKRSDIGPQLPFRLTRWANGGLSLEDLANGHRIELVSFGHTNADAFARLLTVSGESR